ncbi:MAG: DUF1673 family protein [Methanosarcina flavescens]|jgi:hypothetical protein|uniref:DUF1673 family protein n=1 Tax=Methanosarcina flavescens TaxID=1715806 RepID=A0A660HS63_9EURY|nr:DUF1673 family protein [Methanosarcina flavescens]AYK15062.1 DUF1673 family protein [Methanosarcina flavescens]
MSIKATAFEQIKKLLGWCPMKDYLKKDGQEGCFPEFKLENRNIQLVPSSLGLHESGILKVRASLFDGGWVLWILIITFFTIIVSLFFWTCIPEGSYLVIFSGLIMFLMPLMLFLNHPNTASVIPGKIMIKKPMRKLVVIKKEEIKQISVKRTGNRFGCWLIRLIYVIWIPLYFKKEIMTTLYDLKMLFPDYIELSQFLRQLALLTMFFIMFYNSELVAPYQQALEVTTNSNLRIWLYTEEPEKLTTILRN